MVKSANKQNKSAPTPKKTTSPDGKKKTTTPPDAKKIKTEPSSQLPKIPRIPKIKKEKVDDKCINGDDDKSSASSGKIKTEKTKTVVDAKSKIVRDDRQKDISSESPAKRKSGDKHNVSSPTEITDRSKETSPSRGLQVETVYDGKPGNASQETAAIPDSGSETESSLQKKSHDATNDHKGSDLLGDPAREYSADSQKKRKVSPDSKKPDTKTSPDDNKTTPESLISPSKISSPASAARSFSSDSEASYYESDNGAPPVSSSPEEVGSGSSSSSASSSSSYASSDDSLLDNPLDNVQRIKQEGEANKSRKRKKTKEEHREQKLQRKKHRQAMEERRKRRENEIAEHKLKAQKRKFEESLSKISSSESECDRMYAPSRVKRDISNSADGAHRRGKLKKSRENDRSSKHHKSSSRHEKDHHRTKSNANLSQDEKRRKKIKSKSLAAKVERLDEWDEPVVDSFNLPGQSMPDEDIYDPHDHHHSPPFVHDPLNLEGNTYIKSAEIKKEEPDKVETNVPVSPAKPPVKKKKKKRILDEREKTFENTGMSFAACLGVLPTLKKKKKKAAVSVAPSVVNNNKSVTGSNSKPVSQVQNKTTSKEQISKTKTVREMKASDDESNPSPTKSSEKMDISSSDDDSSEKPKKSSSSHSRHKEGGLSSKESKSHGSSSREHQKSEKRSHDGSKVNSHHQDKSTQNGTDEQSSSRAKSSHHDSTKNGSHRHKSSHHDRSKVKSHQSSDRTEDSSHNKVDSSKVISHKDKISHNGDSSKASSHHKDKLHSEASKHSKSSSDKNHKEKDHHKSSSSSSKTHSSSSSSKHDKKDSDRHEKKLDKIKGDNPKVGSRDKQPSRQLSREERKRKWSSSADSDSVLNSPKVSNIFCAKYMYHLLGIQHIFVGKVFQIIAFFSQLHTHLLVLS